MWMICPQAWLTNLASIPSCWQRKTWWSRGSTTRRRSAAWRRTTYKENGHHKECEEKERQSSNQIKPDPQLLLQALTPRDVRILVQAEEELSQTKVRIFLYDFLRHHFWHINFSCSKEFGRLTLHTITSSILRLFHTQKYWWVNIVTWTTLIQPLPFFRFLWVCVQQQQEWRAGAALWLLSKETPFRV